MTRYFDHNLILILLLTRAIWLFNRESEILRRHRGDLKYLLYTLPIENSIVDRNSSLEDVRHCQISDVENNENFPKQIYDIYCYFEVNFFFQGNRSNTKEIETLLNDITRSFKNLQLYPPPNVRLLQRIKKPNPRYHNPDIFSDFDKWWGYYIFTFEIS